MPGNIKKEEITNLMFASDYISEYRYYKQVLLENQHDNIQDIISDLSSEQHENLRQMIEIEMIINAIQYCSDLGAFAISIKNKKIFEIIKMLSSLSETSIKEFYDTIGHADRELLKKYMGYQEINIEQSDKEKYIRSCKRYQTDILKISTFYNTFYQLYLSYKHGLRLIPIINADGRKSIFEACKDNTLNLYNTPEMWWLGSIEITELINNIFKKLYVPLIRKKVGGYLGISFGQTRAQGSVHSTDPPDPKRTIPVKLSFSSPWWDAQENEPIPFY